MQQPPNTPTQRRGIADGDASPDKLARTSGELCLDPAAIAKAYREKTGEYIKPARVRRALTYWAAKAERGDFLTWFITYADPTGETAVWNTTSRGAQ